MNQAQPVRTGDVYPPTAAKREVSHERDKIIGQGQKRGNDLHVEETTLPAGRRMVTASAGGQVMAQFAVPVPGRTVAGATDAVTIAKAIDAAAQTPAGDKPVDLADAAAAQAAEMRATGLRGNVRGGVAAREQQALETNAKRAVEGGGGDKQVTLRDVVRGAAGAPMPADKVATREDAQMVAAAAARNVGKGAGAGAIADAVVAAADMNEGRMM
ncbi:late embryogenesis abundant protein D-34-like [Miscanthus floridulus]|uniref:late embryogenesis abundant protein D-34-like n=1 Tax=Miscanthus floridulus TaxID=154761 RepID=UPI003459490C